MVQNDKLVFLKQKFLETVYVKDASTGYIVVEEFNLRIDPDILEFASRCWAEHFQHDGQIDAVVGLPDAGSRLVSVVASMLHVKHILPSKRTPVVPGAWRDVVSFTNDSFTSGQKNIKSHFGFVEKGMRILVIDDVIAHGSTAIAGIQALQKAGAEVVGIAVLFDKVWQKGVARIKKETGVDAFSLIRIKKVSPSGRLEVA